MVGEGALGGSEPGAARGREWLGLVGLLVVYSLFVVPPIAAGVDTMAPHFDMVQFHLPQINHFIGDPLSVLDYPATSATTPGHHLFLAYAAKVLGHSAIDEHTLSIRLLNALVGHGVLVMVWVTLRRLSGSATLACALAFPLACSSYVMSASVWITTDNGALLFCAMAVHGMIFARGRPGLVMVAATALVLWRQIYLPVVGAFAAPVLWERSRSSALFALACCAPPVLVVAVYVSAWGGFTPGATQHYNELTLNLAVPLHALALTGLLATPFALFFWPSVKSLPRRTLALAMLTGASVALVLWLSSESTYDSAAGRWGSLIWLLADRSPTIGDRSPLVLLLSVLGAFALAVIAAGALRARYYPVELAVLLGYFAGYSAQVFAWQRYLEPAILLTLAIYAARQRGASTAAIAGPVVFGVLLAAVSLARIWGSIGRLLG